MNPYLAYRRPEPSAGWTRMDIHLALYDKALERLDRAEAALRTADNMTALTQLSLTQLIVTELVNGVRLDVDEQMGTNMLRLYEYVVNELRVPQADRIGNARKVLRTLRDGFEAVRDEANALERSGRFETAEQIQLILTTA
ncbi:MAG: hypothetical protein JWO38_1673 [Gemmataceae bacterium]|nr:hypothetical protein [Gemmataceae bacterium]